MFYFNHQKKIKVEEFNRTDKKKWHPINRAAVMDKKLSTTGHSIFPRGLNDSTFFSIYSPLTIPFFLISNFPKRENQLKTRVRFSPRSAAAYSNHHRFHLRSDFNSGNLSIQLTPFTLRWLLFFFFFFSNCRSESVYISCCYT